jgi:hypothetical protein
MKLKKNVAISETGFLFNPSTGDSYSVNPIGLDIITMLNEGKPKDEVKRVIMTDYVCDESTFEKDFYDFTLMLRNYKLLEEND